MLIYRSKYVHPKIPDYESKIKVWLTVLEYTQTLLEVTGKKLGGEAGRWLVIVTVQLFKYVSLLSIQLGRIYIDSGRESNFIVIDMYFLRAVLRLLLVFVYKERMTKSPPVPPLNREKFNKASSNLQSKEGFKLKRSGIVVRNIKYADPIEIRTWKALPCDTDENQNFAKNREDRNLKLAEVG